MDDKFLYLLREEPEEGFAATLRQELAGTVDKVALIKKSPRVSPPHPLFWRISLSVVALCLAFALLLAVSPAVRAAVVDIITTIIVNGTTVWVSDDQPPVTRGEGETYSVVWTPSSPDEIARDFPFFAKLPGWVPQDYVMQERAALFYWSMTAETPSSALIEWKSTDGGTIQLSIIQGSCPSGPTDNAGNPNPDCARQVGWGVSLENEPEVIEINGKSALLFPNVLILTDLSGPIQQWNPQRGRFDLRDPQAFFLLWEADGRTFEIAAKSPVISKEDLVHLAESIP